MAEVVNQLQKQLHHSPALRQAAEVVNQLQHSPALRQAAEVVNQLQKQFHHSPALRQATEVVNQLQRSPALRQATEVAKQLQHSPALRQAAEVAKQLQRSSELFGDAWNERLAEAVGRLERAEDIIRNAPEPERAVKELVEDAATVQEAAPPKAQKSVNMLVHQLAWGLIVQIIAGPELAAAGAAVREVVLSLLVTLLVATTPPDLPPAPGLLMGHEIKPVTTALTLPGDWAVEGLPAIVQRAGPAAAERLV